MYNAGLDQRLRKDAGDRRRMSTLELGNLDLARDWGWRAWFCSSTKAVAMR